VCGWFGLLLFFFFQAEDGIRDFHVTGVQTCALPILREPGPVFGTGSTRYAFARYASQAVRRSVQTTVQVAVDDSPATAAAASSGSTPSCGVMRNSAITSVSRGT